MNPGDLLRRHGKLVLGFVCTCMFTVVVGQAVRLADKACPKHGELCQPVAPNVANFRPGGTLANTLYVTSSS
jgi:hypothetical protein